MRNRKILIFVLALNLENLIEKVLNRIPRNVLVKYQYEILAIDDGSVDRTFEVLKGYQKKFSKVNLRVLYNPENQGYGGMQKLAFSYALKFGFDVVVLLHGDGQYAPEVIEKMFKPILEEKADAVFGSRMLSKLGAIKGRMPMYKFIGNKILTKFQNIILNSNLSEFHTGYRAYSAKLLRTIPFEKNSNKFHFDTQIIIQLMLSKARILEIPIPTYYGEEISHVEGIKYAVDVIKSTLLSKFHSWSLLYQPEYDIESGLKYPLKVGYISSHTFTLANVPVYSNVLSIGCGDGEFEKKLIEKGCEVTGVDIRIPKHREVLRKFINMDLDDYNKLPRLKEFEIVLLLDILEHLNEPEKFMECLRKKMIGSKPKIILSTANIGFFVTRFQLLFGNFNYGKRGVLDLTHKRLFTFKSISRLLQNSGFVIQKVEGIPAPFPEAVGTGWLGKSLVNLNNLFIKFSPGLFSFQIYIEARPAPHLEELLSTALRTGKYDHKENKI
jgi:glycosyltransferase involved in cell wall biosynthesis